MDICGQESFGRFFKLFANRNSVATHRNSRARGYGSTTKSRPNTPPTSPADVEVRALEWLAGIPEPVVRSDAVIRPLHQDIAGLLQLEGVFTPLAWSDANRIALWVALDL